MFCYLLRMEYHLDSFSVEETLEEESDIIATFVNFRDVNSVREEVVRRKLKDASEHEVFREENAAQNIRKISNMFNIQDCIKTPTCRAAQRCDELLFHFLHPLPPSPLPVVVAATLVDPDPFLSQPFAPDINLAYQLSQTKSTIIALKEKCFLNFCYFSVSSSRRCVQAHAQAPSFRFWLDRASVTWSQGRKYHCGTWRHQAWHPVETKGIPFYER